MLAVEIRQAVPRSQILGIVTVVEQTHRTLFIGCVGEGIGEAYLQAMTHSLFDMSLQRMIRGDTCCSVGLRFGRISDVRHAQIDVTTFESLLVRLAVGEINRWIWEACVLGDNRISVGVVLLKLRSFEYGVGR